ncbi:MAG: hypothetical protein HKN68_08585 [Saprospiraceae bacterium]|nr:hypothetical protein [Saprospiraceae bacterium]
MTSIKVIFDLRSHVALGSFFHKMMIYFRSLMGCAALCMIAFSNLTSQTYKVDYHINEPAGLDLLDLLPELPVEIDSAVATDLEDTLVVMVQDLGYLTSSIDSLILRDSTFHFYLYLGETYTLEDLYIPPSDNAILQGSGIIPGFMKNQVLSQEAFNRMKAKVLEHLADRGYPFAGVKVDSIRLTDRRLSSRLVIEKNSLITYDTILITGDGRVNKSFLHKYLRIRQGEPYRQSDILNIRDRINDLSFLQFKADPKISFVNDKAAFDLPLVNRNASRFDFIIGVLPRIENGVRQWTITGDFTGEFVNKLGNGESFSARYQQLRPETQELVLDLDYPFIFNLPFGVDGHFELFRNTTEFLDIKAGLGINYNISRKDYLNFGWSFSSSRLIEVDTTALLQSRKLPQQLDVDVTSGRVAFTMNRFNRLYNPFEGARLKIDVQAGQKKIIPNLTITSLESGEFTFAEAYDSLQLNTFQAQIALELDYFINVRDWSTIRLANRSSYKYNQRRLFTNEYYRIGGNKLLRGFNEQSIFTPLYSVFTTEFRVLLDEFSYISLPFIDYAFLRLDDGTNIEWDQAIGVGIGLNFATKAGIFNIAFAAGNEDRNGINFGNTKIHFGYVNLF